MEWIAIGLMDCNRLIYWIYFIYLKETKALLPYLVALPFVAKKLYKAGNKTMNYKLLQDYQFLAPTGVIIKIIEYNIPNTNNSLTSPTSVHTDDACHLCPHHRIQHCAQRIGETTRT